MSNYIERFRNKMTAETVTSSSISDIIALSTSRVEVILERTAQAIPAVFINDDKETGDEATMYTYTTDGVVIGDYITFLGSSYLVYKRIKNVHREGFIDCFKVILCNVNFTYSNALVKAFYRGPLRGVTSDEVNLTARFGVDSKQESFIMLPIGIITKKNELIEISEQGFRVVALDDLTNPGITYLGLEETILVDTTKVSVVAAIDYVDVNPDVLATGVPYTFTTEDAYLQTSIPVNIIKRLSTQVTFSIPFGSSTSITVSVKVAGVVVNTIYSIGG